MSEKKKSKAELKKEREQKAIEAVKEKARLSYFDAEKQEVKSLKEILDVTTKIQEIFIPILGCKVKIGYISMKNFAVVMAIKDEQEMAMEILFQLFNSADSNVTKKDVEKIPFHISTALIDKVVGEGLGFPKGTTSPKDQQDT